LYQHYYKEVGTNKAKLKSEILEMLKTDDCYFVEKSSVRFNKAADEIQDENKDKSSSKVTSAIVLKYKALQDKFGVLFD